VSGVRSGPLRCWPLLLLAACGSQPVVPIEPAATQTVTQAATGTDMQTDTQTPTPPATPLATPPVEEPTAPALPALPDETTRLGTTALRETSGLAVSRRDPRVLWAINDSGNAPALHALTSDGRALGEWPVAAPNRDWEDLAALRLDGEPHLLIADTGDNARRRDEVVLHLVVEPPVRGAGAAPGTTLVPSRSLRFRYEDGAHDVEAVAVDERDAAVWLLPKEPVGDGRGVAGGVYTLSLAEGADPVARRVATLAPVERGLEARLAAALVGIDLEQPTAFDIAADGESGCLLTYRRPRCFERAEGQSWGETLAGPGRTLAPHALAQAEALALSADGRIVWFTSEGVSAPLRARRLQEPGDP